MTLEQAQEIVEFICGNGCKASVYEDYSGRGMYGETCTGIVTDEPTMVGYACGALGVDFDDVPSCTDNMGLDTILY